MKKILMLGGSAQQVIAISTAKKLGYFTVLCDFLTDNPGQFEADKFYLVSTTDKEAVLDVAKKEHVDGVLAYASDPAAPTAAYVAQKMGLHSNPYKSVSILCNKDMFRNFLKENGFNTPLACGYSDPEDINKDINKFRFPIIVKPVDSSGSKGATVLHSIAQLSSAVSFAFSYSRCHRIIVEEYIEKKHPYLIGGDVFIVDGKIVMWGLMNCHRDQCVNPLVPVGKSYPPSLAQSDIQSVKDTLQMLVDKLQISSGAMNVELIVDKDNKVWPIDIGPRSGGNMIPDLLGMIFNVDLVDMTVRQSMGERITTTIADGNNYYATHNLHSDKNGILKQIIFSDEINKYIIKKCLYKKSGDEIEYFNNASHALGIVFFKFDNKEKMFDILQNINKHICIETQTEEKNE
ncbi:MAG: ATP-grasp domain-containing protein [Oscillospiraceae bacterium]|nr:ATP-grasp domain-containing protein [Oscillospiraceae bacterium]